MTPPRLRQTERTYFEQRKRGRWMVKRDLSRCRTCLVCTTGYSPNRPRPLERGAEQILRGCKRVTSEVSYAGLKVATVAIVFFAALPAN